MVSYQLNLVYLGIGFITIIYNTFIWSDWIFDVKLVEKLVFGTRVSSPQKTSLYKKIEYDVDIILDKINREVLINYLKTASQLKAVVLISP